MPLPVCDPLRAPHTRTLNDTQANVDFMQSNTFVKGADAVVLPKMGSCEQAGE